MAADLLEKEISLFDVGKVEPKPGRFAFLENDLGLLGDASVEIKAEPEPEVGKFAFLENDLGLDESQDKGLMATLEPWGKPFKQAYHDVRAGIAAGFAGTMKPLATAVDFYLNGMQYDPRWDDETKSSAISAFADSYKKLAEEEYAKGADPNSPYFMERLSKATYTGIGSAMWAIPTFMVGGAIPKLGKVGMGIVMGMEATPEGQEAAKTAFVQGAFFQSYIRGISLLPRGIQLPTAFGLFAGSAAVEGGNEDEIMASGLIGMGLALTGRAPSMSEFRSRYAKIKPMVEYRRQITEMVEQKSIEGYEKWETESTKVLETYKEKGTIAKEITEVSKGIGRDIPSAEANKLAGQVKDVWAKQVYNQKKRQSGGIRLQTPKEMMVGEKEVKPVKDIEGKPVKEVVLPEKVTVEGEVVPVKVFRGGKELDVTKEKGKGISVTTDKKIAQRFAKFAEGDIQELDISKDAKILKFEDAPKELTEAVRNAVDDEAGVQKIVDYARKEGFDVVDLTALGEDELRVVNPNVLIKPSPLVEEAKKYKTAEEFVKAQGVLDSEETLLKNIETSKGDIERMEKGVGAFGMPLSKTGKQAKFIKDRIAAEKSYIQLFEKKQEQRRQFTDIYQQAQPTPTKEVKAVEKVETAADLMFQKDAFTFKDKPITVGVVSLLDGVIEQGVDYKTSKQKDFHHNMYIKQSLLDKIDSEEAAIFWFDHGQPVNNSGALPQKIADKIKEQVTPKAEKPTKPKATFKISKKATQWQIPIGTPISKDLPSGVKSVRQPTKKITADKVQQIYQDTLTDIEYSEEGDFIVIKGYPKEAEELTAKQKKGLLSGEKGEVIIPFEWEADIPIKKVGEDAFQDHVEYFENMQLPEESAIRGIKKEIQVTNGKRLAGTITPAQANQKIASLRGDLIKAAMSEGISIFRTGSGKLKLGMREKSEVIVPEDFSEYKKFKDFEMRLGGIVDTARMLQEIDGSLSIEKKEPIEGQAGPVERYIGWRTRDMTIQKLNFNEQWSAKHNDIYRNIKPDSKEDYALTKALNTGETAGMNSILKTKFNKLRKFYDELLDHQNQMRVMRGQDEIPYRKNYSTQILAEAVVWSQLFNKGKEAKTIQDDKFLPDYVMPNKPFNARELAREGDMPWDLMLKSSYDLSKRYLETAERDIFNTSIIQNNKAFISQLEALGYKKAADALARWNAEGYAGVKASIDRVFNLPASVNKALRYTNAIRNLAVFPWRFAFNTGNQIKSLSFTIGRFGYINTMNGLLQYMNPKNRQQLRDIYSFRVKAARAGRVSKQDNNNTLDGIIDEKRSAVDRWNDAGTYVLEEMEKLLTGSAVFASYNVGKKRGLKGEALNQFASDGGGKTQSMYNNEDRPGILRNLIVKSVAPYQTFKFELLNSIRELAGKTGTPPDNRREAVAMLLRFVSAAILMRLIADWASKKDIREIINPLPFAQWTTDPIINKAIGKTTFGQNQTLPSSIGMATDITDGVVRSFQNKHFDRKLRNTMIKYVPGMFGVGGGMAASNLVDTLVAYSQGGIYTSKGKLMFRVETEDIVRGIYSGAWTTEGGLEYKEKKFVKPKFIRDLPFRYGIFGKKKVYPITRKEYEKLPDRMKVGTEKFPKVSLKTEKRPRRVIFIDTPPGRKELNKLIAQDKAQGKPKKISTPEEIEAAFQRIKANLKK